MTFLWYFVKTFESGHLKNDPSLNLHFYPFLTVLSAVVWDLQLLATTNLALSLWSYFNPKSCSPTKFSCRQRNGQQNTTWWTTIVICCMNIVAVFCYKSIYYYIGIIKAAIYQFNLPPVFFFLSITLSKRKLLSFQVCFRVKIIGFGVPLYTQNASKKEQKSLQDKKKDHPSFVLTLQCNQQGLGCNQLWALQ